MLRNVQFAPNHPHPPNVSPPHGTPPNFTRSAIAVCPIAFAAERSHAAESEPASLCCPPR